MSLQSNRNIKEDLICFYSQYGAEVIKVEPPNIGDPLRVWRELDEDGTSPWFRSIARNKKSVAIDLRKPEGREYVGHSDIFLPFSPPHRLVKRLAIKSDVILENFKPGSELYVFLRLSFH